MTACGNYQTENKPVVCIISPNKNAQSETFVRAHIQRLPANVMVLYGGNFPRYQDNGTPLLTVSSFPLQISRAIWLRLLKLPGDYYAKAAFIRFLQTNKVEAVLAEYGPVGTAVMDVCSHVGVPLLVYFRGYDIYSRQVLDKFAKEYPRLFENATAIIAVSRDIKNQLQETFRAPQEKLHYNPSGVDTSLFNGANPAETPPLFVSVGRFVDKKAPHLTILAFQKVYERFPEARLKMIGEGPLFEACRQLVKALDLYDVVEFLGSLPHAEVAVIMRRARALVQHSITPSYGDSEGTPNSLKEAGASGLPVVATRHGGIPEIVLDGKTGFLVDEGDIIQMSKYMVKLAEDPELAARLGEAGREHVCANFAMDQSIEKLWNVIEEAIQENKK